MHQHVFLKTVLSRFEFLSSVLLTTLTRDAIALVFVLFETAALQSRVTQ